MPPLKPPVIDPEVLILTGLVGALIGGLSAMGLFVLNRWADETGRRDRILPGVEPILRQEQAA